MADLIIGIVLLSLLAAGLFAAGARLGRRLPRRGVAALSVLTLSGILCFVWLGRDHPNLSRLLPFANLIVVGNWALPAAGLLAGLVWSAGPSQRWRRLAAVAPLLAIAFGYTAAPLVGTPASGSNIWKQDVCLQSSDSTCSPACAATLLSHHGIDTSEEEMIDLCLTSTKGTYSHGLYRGLKLKTAGAGLRVDLFKTDLDGLKRKLADGPIIITLRLDERAGLDPRYQRQWGWIPGQPHTVVLLAIEGEKIRIAEPAAGPETWNIQSLHDLWTGEGVRIVRRKFILQEY